MNTTTEQWVAIPGFAEYEVSGTGRVRSWKRVRKLPVPHDLVGGRERGWRYVKLCGPDGQRTFRIASLVAAAFLGPRPPGMEVRHLDGVRDNNAISNLAYGTSSENTLDAVRHGTHRTARVTKCPQGHPYDEANTRRRTDGKGRDCRACNRERGRLNYEMRKGAP